MRKLIIATRGSRLALVQARSVQEALRAQGVDSELLEVTTKGDRDREHALVQIGGKGLFVRGIEEKLLNGEADIAVHSGKDLPYELQKGLVIGGVPKAAAPEDVLISMHPLPYGQCMTDAELSKKKAGKNENSLSDKQISESYKQVSESDEQMLNSDKQVRDSDKQVSVKAMSEKAVREKPKPENAASEKPKPENAASEKPKPEKAVLEKPVPEKAVSEKSISEKPKPENAIIIGTGSPRRIAECRKLYSRAVFKDIRGNITTRLRKLAEGQYDAIILAKAGLERAQIDLSPYMVRVFDPETFIPAGCQGILAIECRESDTEIRKLLENISDTATKKRFEVERYLFRALRADCTKPVGVYAEWKNFGNGKAQLAENHEELVIRAMLDGRKAVRTGIYIEYKQICDAMAEELLR